MVWTDTPLEHGEEQPSFQKTCSRAWPSWKPLYTVLEGWDHGLLQTDMGCGVQKGDTEDLWVPSPGPFPATPHTGRAEENLGEEGSCQLLPCTRGLEVGQLGLVRNSELGPPPAQPWAPSPSRNLGPGLGQKLPLRWSQSNPPGWRHGWPGLLQPLGVWREKKLSSGILKPWTRGLAGSFPP